jgi:hypothetical protein
LSVVDREKGHRDAELALTKVGMTGSSEALAEEGKRKLGEDAGAITGARVRPDTAAMSQIDESREGAVDNLT